MLILISPAKTLDFDSPVATSRATQPAFLDRSAELVDELRALAPDQLSRLMSISDKLGTLNFERYMEWNRPFTRKNARQALLAFKGDVYTGLEAETFTAEQFAFAQEHLRILSGLYGVLRPLDLMQPYRLEMGTKLDNPRGKDLYAFWGADISANLNRQLRKLGSDVVVNLASNEYFRAVQPEVLKADIISPAFKDLKNGKYRIISFFAKKARGRMASWLIRRGITDPAGIRKFRLDGYRYNAAMSTPLQPVFTRDEPA